LHVAIFVAYVLARWQSRAKWLLEFAVNLPLILPPVVTGYLLLVLFAPNGPLGRWLDEWLGLRIALTWSGAALACFDKPHGPQARIRNTRRITSTSDHSIYALRGPAAWAMAGVIDSSSHCVQHTVKLRWPDE
jgi:ABC-type sugar transport system permease subunit